MVIKDSIELAPVEVKIDAQGSRIAVTSMDNSLKVFDLYHNDNGEMKENLLFDSNTIDPNNQEYELGDQDIAIDPWRVSFNPSNSTQLITG